MPRIVERDDGEFPAALREASPPVERLWAIGRDLREVGPMVAIVGARTPTPYGVDAAFGLASDLAASGVCVVSGMARGIDGAAHEGALAGGGSTVAVLGCGVDIAYPRQNAALYQRIAQQGTIVSELALGAPPYPKHFPLRNRIIAGIALGTVLVQAGSPTSGAMITARLTLDFGRELFAVPGDIQSEGSWGPHELLRTGQAHLCAGAGDVKDVLGERLGWSRTAEGWLDPPDLPEPERRALAVLARGPARAEDVARGSGLEATLCARSLGALELSGVVERLPAGEYRRVR